MKSAYSLTAYHDALMKVLPSGNREGLKYQDAFFFRDVNTEGKILDIGGGIGRSSYYFGAMGAKEIICLEPELDGSSAGMTDRFNLIQKELQAQNVVRLERKTFQDFENMGDHFDTIISMDSINHLNEDACVTLKSSKESYDEYIRLLKKIYNMLIPGGHVLISDCSRYNIFPLLGLTNPMARTIEYEKHQSPYFWRKIFEEVGFKTLKIEWFTPRRLGTVGKLLLGNCIGSYFFKSIFRILFEK